MLKQLLEKLLFTINYFEIVELDRDSISHWLQIIRKIEDEED